MMFRLALLAAWIVLAWPAAAQDQPRRADRPFWVVDTQIATTSSSRSTAGLRLQLIDQQVRFDSEGTHTFVRSRATVTSAQGLAASAMAIVWSPGRQTPTVHTATITRGDEVIDLLVDQPFEVIRREENAERAVLDGVLTAILQPRGLRVGDVIEFSYTITTRDMVLGDHFEHVTTTAFPMPIETVSYRASWPTGAAVRARGTGLVDLPASKVEGDWTSIDLRLTDTQPLLVPFDAPQRFQHFGQVELTDYASWADASAVMAPLYDRAARVEHGSPLMAAIDEIRETATTPEAQVLAALRLVQDEVRYLALAMGEGGLVPAGAEETWRSRFGDCKGKTALLIAILRELGFEAEAALVSVRLGDGLDERLPLISLFDHVIVRVVLDGQVVWLDGTRRGDRSISQASSQSFGWALPVRAAGASLEALVQPALELPSQEIVLTIDASDGLDAPAKVEGAVLLRGGGAAELHAAAEAVSREDLESWLYLSFNGELGEVEYDEVEVGYDDDAATLRVSFSGRAPIRWTGNAGARRTLRLPNTRLYASLDSDRGEGPFATAPIALAHPEYTRSETRLILPLGGRGFEVEGEDYDATVGGRHFGRTTRRSEGEVVVHAFVRSLTKELSLADATAARPELSALTSNRVEVRAPFDYRPTQADVAAQTASPATTVAQHLERGYVLLRNGDYASAIAAFDAALALEPEHANALANRGLANFYAGDIEQARVDVERAADLDPSEIVAMNGRGLLHMHDGEFEDAVIAFSRSIRYSRGNAWALTRRADAYMQLGEFDKALADLDAVLAIAPTDQSTRYAKMIVLWAVDRRDEALTIADELADESRDNVEVLTTAATMHLEAGDPGVASSLLDQVVELTPNDPHPLTLRAVSKLRRQDVSGAEADFAAARALSTDDATMLNGLCWYAALENHALETALADCDAALAASPESAAILDSRAMVLLRLGRFDESLATYDRALAKAPELPPALYGRGLAKIALGHDEDGRADIAAALAIHEGVADDFKTVSTVSLPDAPSR